MLKNPLQGPKGRFTSNEQQKTLEQQIFRFGFYTLGSTKSTWWGFGDAARPIHTKGPSTIIFPCNLDLYPENRKYRGEDNSFHPQWVHDLLNEFQTPLLNTRVFDQRRSPNSQPSYYKPEQLASAHRSTSGGQQIFRMRYLCTWLYLFSFVFPNCECADHSASIFDQRKINCWVFFVFLNSCYFT